MKFPKLGIFLALLLPFFFAPMSKAQTKPYRVVCPIGTRPLPSGQTLDPTLDQLVAFMCVDRFGNVTFLSDAYLNTTGNPPNSGSGPPVGTCTAGAIYVDTTTGTLYTCNGTWNLVTATSFSYASTGLSPLFTSIVDTGGIALTQNANSVAPGMVLAGPIPTVTGNSFFDHTVSASGNSATASISNAVPSSNSGVAIWFASAAGQSSPPPAPSGFTTLDATGYGNISSIYYKTFSSNAPQNVSINITSGAWLASLSFLGGTISTVTKKASGSTSLNGCATSASFTPTATDSLLVFYSASILSGTASFYVTDSLGNTYQQILNQGNTVLNVGFLLSNISAVARTITICSNKLYSGGTYGIYDLAGPAAYYSGSTGPYNFRYLTAEDLGNVTSTLGFSKIQLQSVSGCTVATASTYDVCKQTINWATPFADTNYFVFLQCRDGQPAAGSSASNDSIILFVDSANFTASSFVAVTQNNRSIAQTCPTIFAYGAHP